MFRGSPARPAGLAVTRLVRLAPGCRPPDLAAQPLAAGQRFRGLVEMVIDRAQAAAQAIQILGDLAYLVVNFSCLVAEFARLPPRDGAVAIERDPRRAVLRAGRRGRRDGSPGGGEGALRSPFSWLSKVPTMGLQRTIFHRVGEMPSALHPIPSPRQASPGMWRNQRSRYVPCNPPCLDRYS